MKCTILELTSKLEKYEQSQKPKQENRKRKKEETLSSPMLIEFGCVIGLPEEGVAPQSEAERSSWTEIFKKSDRTRRNSWLANVFSKKDPAIDDQVSSPQQNDNSSAADQKLQAQVSALYNVDAVVTSSSM